jgi:Pvc16 N-terminal domain
MTEHLDNLLRDPLITRIDGISAEAQVRFQPRDDAWRTHVSNISGNPLNIHLADLRENRKLRSTGRVRTVENGLVSETPAPRRIDCHYLIKAGSPATVTKAIEPTVYEHVLLCDVVRIRTANDPFVRRWVPELQEPLPGIPTGKSARSPKLAENKCGNPVICPVVLRERDSSSLKEG